MNENPYVKVLAVLGGLAVVLGMLLALIPGEQVDLVRTFVGVGLVTVGGFGVVSTLVLAGFGWYLRQST